MQEPQTSKSTKAKYPEVSNIREDLSSLKSNVGQLASHVKNDGLHDLSEKAKEGYENIATLGHKVEKRIKDRPVQSLAIAFASGLFASFLLGRR